ncbi:MAG: MerR family DNA-binding transcriptional regulator, partial [Mycobacterium sp.]
MATTVTVDSPALTIQQLARRTGLAESALRYYERIGLIDPVPRDDSSGHRRYPPALVSAIESL